MPSAPPPDRLPLERARLARTISRLENGEPVDRELLRAGQVRLAEVRVIGLTGPPGAGKSTLADALAARLAGQGHRVAVIAVDPSSPWSGGALLGDRFRMARAEPLDEVYVRSVAARGHPGGLAAAVPEICVALGAFGFDRILLETVGAGQNDVKVKDHADAVLVVSVPGLGDFVQVAKAGLMEIGDIFVVNKCDMPGAEAVRADIEGMLDVAYAPLRRRAQVAALAPSAGERMLRERHGPGEGAESWRPPVLSVSATTETGMDALVVAIDRHLAWSAASGHFRRRRLAMLRARLAEQLALALQAELRGADGVDELGLWAGRVAAAEILPQDAVAAMLRAVRARPAGMRREQS
jgi:LAO/AO transport system kinase